MKQADRPRKKNPYAKAKASIEKQVKMDGVEQGMGAGKYKSHEFKKMGPKRPGHFKKAKSVALTKGKSKKAGRTY